jgi:DNA-binding response OmpR family regulator
MPKVLVVDDDPHIREMTAVLLRNEGMQVLEAADGLKALELMDSTRMDLVVLDLMMPHMDGWELCRHLKEGGEIPVLMITARGETDDKVRGFRTGADDYLVKPFDGRELVERAKALLRRYRVALAQTVAVGGLELDRTSYAARLNGEALDLPKKEFELLFDLASNAGRTRLRDQLIEDLWGSEFDGNERTLDVHINRLRERFPEKGVSFRIQTLRGLGYRLELLP